MLRDGIDGQLVVFVVALLVKAYVFTVSAVAPSLESPEPEQDGKNPPSRTHFCQCLLPFLVPPNGQPAHSLPVHFLPIDQFRPE